MQNRRIMILFFVHCFFNIVCSSDFTILSPDSSVRFNLESSEDGQLSYSVLYKNNAVIEKSPVGITVENNNLGNDVEIGEKKPYQINETYPWRGVHSDAVNHCNGQEISIIQPKAKRTYVIDVRVFNNGVGFRIIVPLKGRNVLQEESTAFNLPEGCKVWYHDLYMHYEGKHKKNDIRDINEGEWAAPPLTIKLADNLGYASITEANLVNYPGMALQANGHRGFQARLGHEQPPNYPFELRYGLEEADRLKTPPVINGQITTPWRVIMIGPDLNTLVNCDILHNLCPAADNEIFPEGFASDWLKPGRAVWAYLTDQPRTFEGMQGMSRLAGQLGFEYHVVEGHWARWPESQQKELVEYSAKQGVKLLFWKHSRELHDPLEREKFFQHLENLGVAGAKIDFLDHEAKETVDLYETFLKDAAGHHLVLDFHGANKPTGRIRTWPNELSREGVNGLESRGPWARHNCTIPFTRFLAGDADYTPMHFGPRRSETSEAHQIATAIIFQSALLVYAEHPQNMINHKAADLIREIPPAWDETIVLPGSEIGEVAAFARRIGDMWFLAIVNGEDHRNFTVDLGFLGPGDYTTQFVRDEKSATSGVSLTRTRRYFGDMAGVQIDKTVVNKDRNEGMIIELQPAGGFVAMFKK